SSIIKSSMRKIDSCNYRINSISKNLKMVIFDNRKDDFYISIRAEKLMNWVDKHKCMMVRTNADNPRDARAAIEFGAEGIGLCRTE
ncbi:putative PEP-binding protein, partial [Clostridioides difficile]